MAHLMLPTAALLSLIGAGLGVHLGNGAIADINPAYFDPDQPRSRFYADLAPRSRADWDAVHTAELRAAESGRATPAGCVGCNTYPEEYYPVHEASLGKPQTGWAEMAEPEPEPAVEIEAVEPDPQVQAVARYAHFAVSDDEQPAAATDETAVVYAASLHGSD